jgi:hypothetical protein
MSKERPTTLRQMQRKIQAEKDASDLKRWIRKHPHSPEAREAALRAEQAALAKVQRIMEADKRREARVARKLTDKNRITPEWLKAALAINPAAPGGLQLRPGCFDATLTMSLGRWKITRGSHPHQKIMWANQALSILSPETNPPKQRSAAEKKARSEQQKRYRAKKSKS